VTGLAANNRAYDGTTTASLYLSGSGLTGVEAGDETTINIGSALGAFDTKSVGTAKAVTVTGLGLTGADAGNYWLAPTFSTQADMTAKGLSVTGITANNRVYDGTTIATLNLGSAGLTGVVAGEEVTLNTGAAMGAFADKMAGTGKTVTISGLGLLGTDAGNYWINSANTLADITAKALTATGVAAISRAYDGTTIAALNLGSAGLSGVVAGDITTLNTGSASGAFSTKTVGTDKTVTVTGLDLLGTDAGNYRLDATTTLADITAKLIMASGITANDKVYDATTLATLNLGSAGLTGVVDGDVATLNTGSAAGAFDTKTVGTEKTVTVTGLSLTGTDSANYRIAPTFSTLADITAKALNLMDLKANNKTFDGNATASLDLSGAKLNGVAAGDVTTLNTASAIGSFATAAVGVGKVVTISGLALSGADAGNYSIAKVTTTADITRDGLLASDLTDEGTALFDQIWHMTTPVIKSQAAITVEKKVIIPMLISLYSLTIENEPDEVDVASIANKAVNIIGK
jgi:hypothetical protein